MYHRSNSYQKPNAIENIRKHIFKVNQEKNNQKVDCLHSFVMFQAVYYGATQQSASLETRLCGGPQLLLPHTRSP